MNSLSMRLGPPPEKSPFQRGREDGVAGKPAPAMPRYDTPWSERLYASGWSRGADERNQLAAQQQPAPITRMWAH